MDTTLYFIGGLMAKYNFYYYDWLGDRAIKLYHKTKEDADKELVELYGYRYVHEGVIYLGKDEKDYELRAIKQGVLASLRGQ